VGDLGIDGRIILNMILKEIRGRGMDSSGSRYRPVQAPCENGAEPWDSIKGVDFLDQLSDYWFLKE
jgi:hypothetical protein